MQASFELKAKDYKIESVRDCTFNFVGFMIFLCILAKTGDIICQFFKSICKVTVGFMVILDLQTKSKSGVYLNITQLLTLKLFSLRGREIGIIY